MCSEQRGCDANAEVLLAASVVTLLPEEVSNRGHGPGYLVKVYRNSMIAAPVYYYPE